jgi:hypothetical protein
MLDDCETLTGWSGSKTTFVLDPICTQGQYSVGLTAPNLVAYQKRYTDAINTGFTKETGYLAFDLYVSDINLLATTSTGNDQLELTSSGTYDNQELHWDYVQLNLQTGWNHLEMPFSQGITSGGEINLTNVNFFRFYSYRFTSNAAFNMKLDNIRFISY